MSEERAFNQAAQELGALLKAKRLDKKIAIGEVAERLKFTAKKIESLESGDYKGLPEPIFIKGFIKAYARFLEIDNDTLGQLLNQAFPEQASKNVTSTSSSENRDGLNFQDQQKPFRLPKWLPLVGVLIVVVIAIGFWQSKSSEQTRTQEKSTLEVGEVAQPALDNPNVQIVPMASTSASAVEASTPEPAAASAAVAASGTEAVADGVLHIKVRYRSNLIVTDADGTPLHSGIVAANSVHQFKGKTPYQVRIGYATGSEVNFNDQKIDVQKHYVDGKTAAFTVPQK
ncbi:MULTISPECIES: helix-turn-helix domain-containing protein [Vitreoscilla]|uniref:DUF4115 domain-containing protein n=1 Tax=Vitreoscilla stercoraria TaxID=61 RepID=A0ABY4EBR3_VITST|nr:MULTISPECIES: helix-turn-helix domain-containing protein [Vitreoscilla]AUZ05773.2 hypothetical protein ADP71_24230 [Vitreoscilla sp. C1]UOO92849.1 DUF4115 domain-containing protein [Vitreoscilla stercoraria]